MLELPLSDSLYPSIPVDDSSPSSANSAAIADDTGLKREVRFENLPLPGDMPGELES